MPGITEDDLKRYKVINEEYIRLVKELWDLFRIKYKKYSKAPKSSVTANYSNDPRPSNRQPILSFDEAIRLLNNKAQELIEEIRKVDKEREKYRGILLKLSAEERDYVYYRYYVGMKHLEVAKVMHCAESTIDKIRVRVLKKLQNVRPITS
jgi:DNA-directed RNA polymerase specialized sigma24 family protein